MMKLYSVSDKEFKPYGKVLDIDCCELISTAEKIEMPEAGANYVLSVEDFEKLEISKFFRDELFGGFETQTGYCYGHSDTLNALEWHKFSEINVAVTDMILFLGNTTEMEGDKYNSENLKAFLVKKGQVIEVYGTTMHFCPCETSKDGFGCIVVLPKDTNAVLDYKPADKTLFKKSKWLIAHEENTELIAKGVASGIYGKNLKVGIDV